MSVSTVQNEQNGGQIIDNQAEIQKALLGIQQALDSSGAGGGTAPAGSTSDATYVAGEMAGKTLTNKAGGPVGSAFFSALTDVSDNPTKPSSDMIFSGGKKGSRHVKMDSHGMSAMPSGGYFDRRAMDAMNRKGGDKAEIAQKKMVAKMNGELSGKIEDAGNIAANVNVKNGKYSQGSIGALSAAPGVLADPVFKKHQDNLNTATNNLNNPSFQSIVERLGRGDDDAERMAARFTHHQQQLFDNVVKSESFKDQQANQTNRDPDGLKNASNAPSAPTPPSGPSK